MKFKAHQSFFIRKGWLNKGLKAVRDDSIFFMPANNKQAMDSLGIGSNQVTALRYWLETTKLIEKNNKAHRLTELGKRIFERDPYIEELGTLWTLHYNIATNKEEATSWYFLFNEFADITFNKELFARSLNAFILSNNETKEVALSSIEADFNCIASTYVSHEQLTGKPASPENVIDCPLGDLKVLSVSGYGGKRELRKLPANLSMLPNELIMYAIGRMSDSKEEIQINRLLNEPYSPGKLFNLDSIALLTKLYELQDEGCVHMTRTAGLDVVRVVDRSISPVNWLDKYYKRID